MALALTESSPAWEIALPPTHSIWEELAQLTPADFPMKLFFLDKSASMKFDPFTNQALKIATHYAISPQRGSSITFLLASPGETQVTLRRPRDANKSFSVELGSTTWVNEPVFKVLEAIAPTVEAFNIASWSKEHGEPPLQVVCITDGMDNMSPPHLARLSGLVDSIKKIVGPERHKELYRPMADPSEKCSRDEVVGSSAAKVPVWLLWLAMGSGGKQFLKSCTSVPKEVAIVDAVIPPIKDGQKGGFYLEVNADYEVGDRVGVLPPAWVRSKGVATLMDPEKPRPAVISHLPSDEFPLYTVLHEDEVEEVGVEPERLVSSAVSSKEGRWIPPGTLEAISLVQAVVLQPTSLVKLLDSSTGIVSIWNRGIEPSEVLKRAGVELVSEEGLKEVITLTSMIRVKLAACSPPHGFLQSFMEAVGPAAGSLDARGRGVARTILHGALQRVAQGCTVCSSHLYEEFHQSIPKREALTEESVSAWLQVHCQPALDAMAFLVREQVICAQQVVLDCEREGCSSCQVVKQQVFICNDSRALSAVVLSAVIRLTSPGWDVLGRCLERYRNMHPSARREPQVQVILRKRPVHNATPGAIVRSSSTPQLAGYRRRSAPMLCCADGELKSFQAVCSGRPNFRKLCNRAANKSH